MSSGQQISKLFGPGINRDVAPSHVVTVSDPSRILAYTPNGTLSAYPITGGAPLFSVAVPKAGYLNGYGMKISPDGRFVAIRDSPDTISLWSMTDGKITHRFGVPPFSTGDFAFTSDGNRLAIPGGAFSVYVWNTVSGAPVAQLRAPHAGAYRLWFTPTGDSLVMSAHFDSTLLVSPMPTRAGATRDRIFTRGERASDNLALLFGAVTDSISPLFQAEVAVFTDSTSRTPIKWTRSDEDGLFAMDSLSPGRVFLRVRRIGYNAVSRELDLSTGLNSVSVPMRRSGGLQVITSSASETSR
jgi:WD40 repeat protein